MLLSISQRINLLQLLPPAEGDAFFLRSVRRLRKSLSLSDEEISKWGVLYHPDARVTWDGSKVELAEVDLSGTAAAYVSLHLEKLSDARRLPEELLEVYDSFFPEES